MASKLPVLPARRSSLSPSSTMRLTGTYQKHWRNLSSDLIRPTLTSVRFVSTISLRVTGSYAYKPGLMHWPAPSLPGNKPDREHNWIDTWKAMEAIYKAHPEKVRAIGVSNVSIDFFEPLLKAATVIPAANQVELHPYVSQMFHNVRAW